MNKTFKKNVFKLIKNYLHTIYFSRFSVVKLTDKSDRIFLYVENELSTSVSYA